MTVRLLLDTDIGTDVDDCLALAFILGSPELSLEGITCVYGDVLTRAKMTRRLLTLKGVSGLPIHLGARKPLLGLRDVYWEGHEGQGLLDADTDDPFPREHAVEFLIRTVMASPGEIHLLAIGPLTNVALAMAQEPGFAGALAHLTIMGGVFRDYDSLDLPATEHNIVCDPEAAHLVLASGAPISLVPLDVTTRCRVTVDGVARLRASGDGFHAAVADQIERYPRFGRQGHTALHDPLAAATIVMPDLVEWRDLSVAVETEGRLTTAMTVAWAHSEKWPKTARVALRVDTPRAEAFVLERMLG